MGIFDSKEQREKKREEEQKRVKEFLSNLSTKLDQVDPVTAKQDLKILVESLVGFFGEENPKLFIPGKEEGYYIKEFFQTVIRVGTSAMIPGNDMGDKIKGFMNLLPVIQRYATIHTDKQ